MINNIRNFCIIAHIDHGKSTLADRFLEITGAVPKRKMKEQYLDQLELERERGITIKMAPVRMIWHPNNDYNNNDDKEKESYSYGQKSSSNSKQEFVLNLIDTPGHSDFSYEVSRALAAVEGAILLVDVSQGVQAQTLANFRVAKASDLKIIGAVNKIDLFPKNDPRLLSTVQEVAELLNVPPAEIFFVSGKTGEGAAELLEAVIREIPPPSGDKENSPSRTLIFDSFYDNHKGVVASVRVFSGEIKENDELFLIATETASKIKEIGFFTPELKPVSAFGAGEIGYVATGIKDPQKIKIGDTIITNLHKLKANYTNTISEISGKFVNIRGLALPGYKVPKPVVFVSFYPEESDDHELLKTSLQKLKLNDSAILIEPDNNEVLGRGYKLGFLGRLHFEITVERLEREFGVKTVNTFPSVEYRVKTKNGEESIVKPEDLPSDFTEIWEPIVKLEIILPANYLNNIFSLQKVFRMRDVRTESFSSQVGERAAYQRMKLEAIMPLAELVSDFDDQLKSATQGHASFSYEFFEYVLAEIEKVDVLLAGDLVPGLSRFLPKESLERESRLMVKRLKELLPRQQFTQSIQATTRGRVIAREDIPAMRKDVTGYLYGGDRTRKMKLWKKQKRGKERLKERGKVRIEPAVFKELLKR